MANQEEQEKKEEQKWFKTVQNKLKKYISDPRWDSLSLTSTEWDVVLFVMKAKDVNELPILINERIIDNLFIKISTQFKQMKIKGI